MSLFSETVAIPLTKGLDITTDARLVNPPSLLEATNAKFDGGGSKKRRGHAPFRVRGEAPLVLNSSETVWNFGTMDTEREANELDELYWTGAEGRAGALYGVASRDNETIFWDGFRLFSYSPSQLSAQSRTATEVVGSGVMPSLAAQPVAKFNETQGQPELGDNGTTKIVAWVNDGDARYAIYDSVSEALLAEGTFAVTDADYLRAFTLGDWMHVAVRDADDDLVKLFSISSLEPNDITYRSYGPATHFDVFKLSDSEALLARTNLDGIHVTWVSTVGTGSVTRTHFNFASPIAGEPVHISIAATETALGIAWAVPDADELGFAVMDHDGTNRSHEVTTYDGTLRLTLAPMLSTVEGGTAFQAFWDNGTDLQSLRFYRDGTGVHTGSTRTRFRMRVASRAWGVGDRTFLWAGYNSTLQSTWFLLDEALLPVGKLDFGVANVAGHGTNGYVAGVNWYEEYEFHTALSSRLRVDPDEATDDIYTEPYIRGAYLDFLPTLRSAQAGRTLYIAGAQLWSYDGRELVEAGFHTGPEPTLEAVNGGALTAEGTYSYRVDLCYRNAQNEEVRSLSILSDSLELGPGEQAITLTIPTVLTRREGSYFLIYRNAMSSGTPLVNWWLLNSRDPDHADFRANDLSVSTVTFTDAGAVDDEEIQERELHPATDTYLQPISAPACEIIAAGRDRLWVAGGELLPGQLAPSRLFDPGECPSFNAYLAIQVDRSNEPVTALGFIGEIAAIFRPNSTYILDSDGPDNIAQGAWNPPRLALADIGAVSQESVARIVQGLIFQSSAGFRVLGAGGGLTPIGVPVDRAIADFDVVGAIVVEKDQEVRFYGEDETYVYNYLYDTWARWTCGGVGVAKGTDGYALLAREDGTLWIETPGVWTDGGLTYTHRIRTSWLHGGNIGDFQRVRRVGGLGRAADSDNPNHSLRLELYYDERDFWEDRHEWDYPDSTVNEDEWGAGAWGDGVWGDTSATISNLEDLTWEWQRDPARQKCSVVSISLEDVNTDGPGFELSAFTLELARKSGLNRGPERSGTGTYR